MVAHLPMNPEILAVRRLDMSIHGPQAMETESAAPKAATPTPTPPAVVVPAAPDETTSLLRELVRGQMALAEMVQSLVTHVSTIEQGKLVVSLAPTAPRAPQPVQGAVKGSSTTALTPAATRASRPAKGKAASSSPPTTTPANSTTHTPEAGMSTARPPPS